MMKKKWLVPIGLGVVVAGVGVTYYMKKNKKENVELKNDYEFESVPINEVNRYIDIVAYLKDHDAYEKVMNDLDEILKKHEKHYVVIQSNENKIIKLWKTLKNRFFHKTDSLMDELSKTHQLIVLRDTKTNEINKIVYYCEDADSGETTTIEW